MDNNTFLLGAIAVSFLINLSITIIFRVSDKKYRSLKNINITMASFRNEIRNTSERVVATAKDCDQVVSARIEEAQSTIENIAASLDRLKVHQTELSALDRVCRDYRVALEKLKVQTEQAEARISAVQKSVRDAEEIKSFAEQFQSDAEKLTNRLQDTKTEYVMLVASSEDGLKKAAARQKEENTEMLSQFAVSIERYKSQLADYIAGEKSGFTDECMRQEEILREGNEAFENRKSGILAAFEEEKTAINALMARLSEEVESAERRYEEDKSKHNADLEEISASRKQLKSDSESAIAAFSESVKALSSSGISDVSASAESLKREAENRKKEAEDKMEELQAKMAETADAESARLASELKIFSESADKAREEACCRMTEGYDKLSSDLSDLLSRCRADLDALIDDNNKAMDAVKGRSEALAAELSARADNLQERLGRVISDAEKEGEEKLQRLRVNADKSRGELELSLETSYQNVVKASREQLEKLRSDGAMIAVEIADEISKHKNTIDLLNESSQARISESVDYLTNLRNSIKENQENLSAVCQEITVKREELYRIYQERVDEEAMLSQLQMEANKVDSEMRIQKINEDSSFVRSKSQQSAARKAEPEDSDDVSSNDSDSSSEPVDSLETAAPATSDKKKKIEDMFEEFPDDIYIGEEETVDLSDED